jgi:hypothetical protein
MLKKFQHDREIAGLFICDYGLWANFNKLDAVKIA